MPPPIPGQAAGGGLISSSAGLLVLLCLIGIFLAHRGIREWLQSRHSAVREHLYGPGELYHQPADDKQNAEDASDTAGGAPDPDDGFDYGIFATAPPPESQ